MEILVSLILFLLSFSVQGETLLDFNCKASYYWLHIPKTSSTFCLSLQHVCCPERYENVTSGITINHVLEQEITEKVEHIFQVTTAHGCAYIERKGVGSSLGNCRLRNNHHHPLPRNFNTSINPALVILRNPTSRLISSFLDSHHHEGMEEAHFQKLKEKMFPDSYDDFGKSYEVPEDAFQSPSSIRKFVHAARIYSEDPAMKGCQTKMILGYECSDSRFVLPMPFNRSIAQLAIDRLKQFYFVGIFEEYAKSLELFHAQVAKRTEPSVLELVPTRSGDHVRASILQHYFVNYTDQYDEMLYEAGKKIFQHRYQHIFQGI